MKPRISHFLRFVKNLSKNLSFFWTFYKTGRGIVTVDKIQIVEYTGLTMLSNEVRNNSFQIIVGIRRWTQCHYVKRLWMSLHTLSSAKRRSQKKKSRFCVVSNDGCKKKMEVGVRFIHENERCIPFHSTFEFYFFIKFFYFFYFSLHNKFIY